MSGLDGATATAPTEALVSWWSVTTFQVTPPSVDFHRPPPVAPKWYSLGRAALPATAIDRPPRRGPMLRHWSAPKGEAWPIASPERCAVSVPEPIARAPAKEHHRHQPEGF